MLDQKELNKILDDYGVELWGVISTKDGIELVLNENIYYKAQEEMESKIRQLGDIKSIDYHNVV